MFNSLPNSKRPWQWPVRIIAISALLATVYLIIFYHTEIPLPKHLQPAPQTPPIRKSKPQFPLHTLDGYVQRLKDIAEWQKPPELKVMGLVFFGRRRFVSVLQCYLQRNLVENGGVLDGVIFVVKTEVLEDLAYLEELLASNEAYSAQYQHQGGFDYSQMWNSCEKGVMYVKIDDDVLYIEDSTIRSMVKRKYEHPEYVMVSANLVVQYFFAWVHHHLGAVHPYYPDLKPLEENPTKSWRTSELPVWEGPEDYDLGTFDAPKHHRWLPLPPGTVTDNTPVTQATYQGGPGWDNWMVAAQQHYSFLENLEKGELWRYSFDKWDTAYDRVSINLMAIMGDDVVAMSPMPKDDEEYITTIFSKNNKRHVVLDGHGTAVHFGYFIMKSDNEKAGIDYTDVLDRYRVYAEENICPEVPAH